MASGTITGSYHSNGNYRIKLVWSSVKDTENNRSTLTIKTYLDADWSLSYSARKNGSTTADGQTKTWYSDDNHSGTGEWLLRTETFVIDHNANGEKSLNISGWFDLNITLGSGAYVSRLNASGNITLDKIDVYRAPEILLFKVNRCNSDGTLNKQGDYAKVEGQIQFDSKNSTIDNSYKIESKTRNISNYTEEINVSNFANTYSFSHVLGTYDVNLSYDLKLTIRDNKDSKYSNVVLGTIVIAFDMGRDGIGAGKYWTKGSIDAGAEVYINNGIRIDECEYIPTGDDSVTYWLSIKQGVYFCSPGRITNQPSEYAFIMVFRKDHDINVIWYKQSSGPIWRKSGNANGLTDWTLI